MPIDRLISPESSQIYLQTHALISPIQMKVSADAPNSFGETGSPAADRKEFGISQSAEIFFSYV
jgi:hypothetical protein